jgi:hypothetical protein
MRSRTFEGLALVALLVGTGCAARGAVEVAREEPSGPEADVRVALYGEPRSAEVRAALDALEARFGREIEWHMVSIIRDPEAHPIVRGNALLALADRDAIHHLPVFRTGLRAEDPRTRAAAAAGLGTLLPTDEEAVLPYLEIALADPDHWVQAKALEGASDHDPALLRRYLASDAAAPELRIVALDLLRVAEQRGAPWPADAAPGTRSHTTASGLTLTFRPTRSWPQWEAAVGELSVARAGGAATPIAAGVEAVGGVVPVALSPDERFLAYEVDRRIFVRSLQDGRVREVGPGIAPRPIPFSAAFVFLRELSREGPRDASGGVLTYEVTLADFEGEEGRPLGVTRAEATMERRGGYAPPRWMRVREYGGAYSLVAEGMESFVLPDPFTDLLSP